MPSASVPAVHSESVTRAIEQNKGAALPLELVADTDIPVAPGEIIGGRYVVDGMLAAGGMGVVYTATHTELEQRVAIKFLRDSYSRSESLVQRFLNEARAAATLKNEHVVRVIDVGQLEGGRPYLVMEHLEGTDLEALLMREGPFDPDRAVRYVLEVCEALEEAHACGIIHRDIKPENLFVATAGSGRQQLKVVDFGLAKRIDAAPLVVTGPQDSMGSPCYMSPEQITTPHEVDTRTDIWSVGCVLYRLLTLTMPFDGSTILEVYARVLNAQPKPLGLVRPDLDRGIEAIVARCLEKDPKRRYQTIAELSAALTAYQGARSSGLVVSEASIPAAQPASEPPPAPERQGGGGLGLFAVAAVVLIASFCGAWSVRDGAARNQARAVVRGWVEWAMPRTSGGLETVLENADTVLAPVQLPEDLAVPKLGDRYVPLTLPSRGITTRHALTTKHGEASLLAEREHEAAFAGAPASLAPPDDTDEDEDATQKEAEYRRFLQTQRNIASQVDQIQNVAPAEPPRAALPAAPTTPPPVPRPAKPSIDDLKPP
jgi:hypothetical protein